VVGVEFDPLLAKVIAHALTRREAAMRLALALERARIHGVVTNRDLLVAILRHPEFLAGNTTTSFLEDHDVAPRRVRGPEELRTAAIAAALTAQERRRGRARVLATLPSGWRNSVMPPERVSFRHGEAVVAVEYRRARDASFALSASGRASTARVRRLAGDELDLDLDGRRLRATVHGQGDRWWVHGPAGDVAFDELPRFPEPEPEATAGGLVAPMPGNVIAVHIAPGDPVGQGQLLAVIEAMKMEHRILAPAPGVVSEVLVAVGEQVASGDLLVVIAEAEPQP
jgi:propionyl-CoA carboxylase alpha chain